MFTVCFALNWDLHNLSIAQCKLWIVQNFLHRIGIFARIAAIHVAQSIHLQSQVCTNPKWGVTCLSLTCTRCIYLIHMLFVFGFIVEISIGGVDHDEW